MMAQILIDVHTSCIFKEFHQIDSIMTMLFENHIYIIQTSKQFWSNASTCLKLHKEAIPLMSA